MRIALNNEEVLQALEEKPFSLFRDMYLPELPKGWSRDKNQRWRWYGYSSSEGSVEYPCKLGVELGAQEEWTQDLPFGCECGEETPDHLQIIGYRADDAVHTCTVTIWPEPAELPVPDFNESPKWEPPETMPNWASRLYLKVVEATPVKKEGGWYWWKIDVEPRRI